MVCLNEPFGFQRWINKAIVWLDSLCLSTWLRALRSVLVSSNLNSVKSQIDRCLVHDQFVKMNLYMLFLTWESCWFCFCDKKCLIPYCDVLKCCFHIMTCCILHLWDLSVSQSHTGEKDNSDFPTKALGRSVASCPFNDPPNFYFIFF